MRSELMNRLKKSLLCTVMSIYVYLYCNSGRAIAEAVSRWLPTAAARVQSRVWSSGICGGQSGVGGRFSPTTSVSPAIHSTKFSILTITRARYNRPVSGRRAEWTQFGLHPPLCNYIVTPLVLMDIKFMLCILYKYYPGMKHYHQSPKGASRRAIYTIKK
jgi:hypothetical protein